MHDLHDVVAMLRLKLVEQDLTVSELARQTKIPQSTLHRALFSARRLTGTHEKLCMFFGISLDMHTASNATTARRLSAAILDAWDGSPEQARLLLKLMGAVGRLQKHVLDRPRKRSRVRPR